MALLRYGALGFGLAFAALPLYIHLPNHYARELGGSLAWMGGALLLTRLADAWTDVYWGRLLDAWWPHRGRLRALTILAALLLALGMTLLFFPIAGAWQASLVLGTLLATQAHSLLSVCHQSWGAQLRGSTLWRSRVVAAREAWTTIGVVVASTLPLWLGWRWWAGVLWLALTVGMWLWWSGPQPNFVRPLNWPQVRHVPIWQQATLRAILSVQALSALANAAAASLVLFVIQDVMQTPDLQAPLLLLYFLAAVASLPVWLRLIRQHALAWCWRWGHGIALLVFAAALGLGPDRWGLFAVIALGSGAAVGADLVVPAAMLAGHIQAETHPAGGTIWGAWNMVNKLALAAASGLVLPWLSLCGYVPGNTNSDVRALALTYALLPLTLKAMSLLLLWHHRHALSPNPTKDAT